MSEKFAIITGTPGTGKTTVTKILSDKGWISYDITSYVKEKSLFLGYDLTRESLIIDEELLQEKLIKASISHELVILDGHTATLVENKFVKYCFVLRVDLSSLNERLLERNYAETKVSENIQAEIMESCLLEAHEAYDSSKIYMIDTNDKTPEEVASFIESILQRKVDLSDLPVQ